MSDNHTDHFEDKYVYHREDPSYMQDLSRSDAGFSAELSLKSVGIALIAGLIGIFLIFGPLT
jgi:hypothetical protein